MKLRVKPFTLFLYGIVLVLIVIGAKIISNGVNLPDPLEPLTVKKPEWTGLITLWDVNYVDCGTGSNAGWLNRQIQRFERNNPGVFIDVRRITPERMKMYFEGNMRDEFLPDIIALPVYEEIVPQDLLLDLKPYIKQNELDRLHHIAKKRITRNGKIIGIPWMIAPYALIFNNRLVEEANIIIPEEELDFSFLDSAVRNLTFSKMEGKSQQQYFGFCTYSNFHSRPLLSIIHGNEDTIIDRKAYNLILKWYQESGALPQGMADYTFNEAWELFARQGRVGILLGNVRAIYQMRSLQQMGKGFDITVKGIPADDKKGLFSDQVGAYGIIKTGNREKLGLCVSFLKMLIEDDAQKELKLIGAFPAVSTIEAIYQDDPQMSVLESSLQNYIFSPDDRHWKENGERAYAEVKQILGRASGTEE
ncbi:MAG: hypothetical protein GX024_02940 [Clostridiales bacterium]|nr:hypothetical protein [Clostridiales bacterium]